MIETTSQELTNLVHLIGQHEPHSATPIHLITEPVGPGVELIYGLEIGHPVTSKWEYHGGDWHLVH